MSDDGAAFVAKLASSQIETLAEGAVVEVCGGSVTVTIGSLNSDMSVLVPTAGTVSETPNQTIYRSGEEDDS